jgi:hypothetical protein
MVNYPNYLSGSQDDINKRLLEMILKLAKSEGADITELETDVTALKSAVGDKDTDAGSLKKRCKDIETAIGDESTAASILGRIKALEDAS